jgi:hypothetical protein
VDRRSSKSEDWEHLFRLDTSELYPLSIETPKASSCPGTRLDGLLFVGLSARCHIPERKEGNTANE